MNSGQAQRPDLVTLDASLPDSGGLEAVRMAQQLNPSSAVLDIGLPLLTGIEIAREIQKDASDTEVVLLTMYEEEA